MAKMSVNPNRATEKTVRTIDRKREKERKRLFLRVRDYAEQVSIHIVQRLIDLGIIETDNAEALQQAFKEVLYTLPKLEDFDVQMKIAPVRTLVQEPNIVSLYLSRYLVEDLINNDHVKDVFGDDIDIYRAIDSVFRSPVRNKKSVHPVVKEREKKNKVAFLWARENAEQFSRELAASLVDGGFVETGSVEMLQQALEQILRTMAQIDGAVIGKKITPVRNIVKSPNIVSLYLSRCLVDDLIENPHIQDVFGDDLTLYKAIDKVYTALLGAY